MVHNNSQICIKKILCLITIITLHTHKQCSALIVVNDTKSSKEITLYTTVNDHVWMRAHNSYQNAPVKNIALFRKQMVSKNILKTHPMLLNNILIRVAWDKHAKHTYEKTFTMSDAQALGESQTPHHFSNYHVIRLFDAPQGSKDPIQAELLYVPHGIHYLRTLLAERRALEKNQ